MSSVSGLSREHRIKARDLAVKAALLGVKHRDEIHYTQGARRWDGIRLNLKAWQNEYPRYADCSAFATWCIWNGLDHFGVRDTVNGQNWLAGYTGTMLSHGKRVVHIGSVLRADCAIYGDGGTGEHTAIVVGTVNGKPWVASHGSEQGPFYLPYDYRRDLMQFRRYI